MVAVFGADVGDALGEELGAEALGLDVGALGELVAGEAFRKAEVVFDLAGAGSGLAAGGEGLDEEGFEAFGGSVDACGEAGGAGTDDDHVVVLLLGLGTQADALCDLGGGRLDEGGAVTEEDDGELGLVEVLFAEKVEALRGLLRVEPLEGDPVAGEEVPDLVVAGDPSGC